MMGREISLEDLRSLKVKTVSAETLFSLSKPAEWQEVQKFVKGFRSRRVTVKQALAFIAGASSTRHKIDCLERMIDDQRETLIRERTAAGTYLVDGTPLTKIL